MTWKTASFAIVGSPQTVRQKLERYQKELGCGVVLTGCQTGTMPHELARKSMELLAREVLPHVLETLQETLATCPFGVPCSSLKGGDAETSSDRSMAGPSRSCTAAAARRSSTCTAPSASRSGWLPFYQAWAKQFTIYVPPHPGFHKSGGFDQIDTIEDMAFHYVEMFDLLGLDEVILGGVSLGGWIAAEFALPLAGRVKKL